MSGTRSACARFHKALQHVAANDAISNTVLGREVGNMPVELVEF
jgi:hypothetical protein